MDRAKAISWLYYTAESYSRDVPSEELQKTDLNLTKRALARLGVTQAELDALDPPTLQPGSDEPLSPGLTRHYRRAAREIGELFCWCLENLPSLRLGTGPAWLEQVKERLLDHERTRDR